MSSATILAFLLKRLICSFIDFSLGNCSKFNDLRAVNAEGLLEYTAKAVKHKKQKLISSQSIKYSCFHHHAMNLHRRIIMGDHLLPFLPVSIDKLHN